MSQEFDAIYENGVLRPLVPLDLSEPLEVRVILHPKNGTRDQGPTREELQEQQAALDEIFRKVDALPQESRNDGLSNRDHDQVLYGSPQ
jgi:predicted DNA-binding antitoxin AbrB/MazE fold protein